MKICTSCKVNKELVCFSINKAKPSGLQTHCKECQKTYYFNKSRLRVLSNSARRYAAKKEDILAKQRLRKTEISHNKRINQLKDLYGMSLSDYDTIFKNQLGSCAICEGVNLDGKRLSVDHDHKTGKVRGLLCANCNLMIGNSKDSVGTLIKGSEYLEKRGYKVSL